MNLLIMLAVLSVASPSWAQKKADDPSPESLTLEKMHALMSESQLEREVEGALRFELGVPDVHVSVRIRIVEKFSGGKAPEAAEEAGILLPGVPADRGLPAARKGEAVKPQRSTILVRNVTLLLGEKVPSDQAAEIKSRVVTLAGLDLALGDTVSVRFQEPTAADPQIEAQKEAERSLAAQRFNLLLAVLALVIGVALLGLVFMRRSLREVLEGLKEVAAKAGAPAPAAGGGGGGGGGGPTQIELTGQALASAAKEESSRFGFVDASNLDRFREALAEAEPAQVSIALASLPERLAAKAFAKLPIEAQGEVLISAKEVQFEDPQAVETFEEEVRSAMGFKHGGLEKMALLLHRLEDKAQKELLRWLGDRDADLAREYSSSLFDIAEILLYDQQSIQRIFREIGGARFVRLLEPLDEAARAGFYEKLGPHVVTLLKEQLQAIPQVSNEAWKEEVLAAHAKVKDLSAKGIIPPFEKISRKRNPALR